MQHKKIPLADTKAFSPFFLDYIDQKAPIKPFYNRFPLLENFKDQIGEKSKSFPSHNREVLVSTFQKQYQHLKTPELVSGNISALADPKTFTVTTGHQLNIFTGPLYVIFKIVTVINACKKLKATYPDFHFVPVYWMASEDHDYDEIKYFDLYGKKYVWETSQKGAVGRFSTKGLEKLLQEIPGDAEIFKEAYTKNKILSDAVRHYVNALFGNEGVVVLDADDRDLKSLFKPVMEEDLFKHTTIKLVNETNKGLADPGYKTQVFCRDINFFYLDKNIRERIEKRDDRYFVLETQLSFSEDELRKMIEQEPEKLSPNVILRPLYQEIILPNLAYVGGPAENTYWLQLKKVFDHFMIPFPMLMPRNFGVVVDHTIQRKVEKTGLDLIHFFEEKNYLYNHWVLKNSGKDLTVGAERTTIMEIYEQLKRRAESIDKTLGPFTAAEGTRVMNGLEKIERKLLRAEKRLHTDKLRQIDAVKNALFPNGILQERVDNFLNFYQRDKQFIAKLISCFDAFDYKFNVLIYTGA
ncbi:MAG: bacillithiol biosynthesis cysteine-adding enzyme BshC [Cyclobacteriaceae bacterium]